ncbi:MAG: hypothetical protein JWQ96_1378 [Segetibacter sp.]|nr:hypothetical protein [Segetibacter sp.]
MVPTLYLLQHPLRRTLVQQNFLQRKHLEGCKQSAAKLGVLLAVKAERARPKCESNNMNIRPTKSTKNSLFKINCSVFHAYRDKKNRHLLVNIEQPVQVSDTTMLNGELQLVT